MILVLDRRDASLTVEAGSVVVRIDRKRYNSVPLALLTHVIVTRKTLVDTSTLAGLADSGVVITLLGGRFLESAAVIVGQSATLAITRRAQYRAALCGKSTFLICRTLIAAKTRRQSLFVRTLLDACPQHRYSLKKIEFQLRQSRESIRNAASIESLRGIEGANASAVFAALSTVTPARLEFHGRKRRPPPDPVNALLSLTYTLLQHTAVQCCHSTGLDPLCGYLHQTTHGRESLACDVMELLRPRAEELAWRCLRSENLRAEHFKQRDGGCQLGKAGRGIFYGLVAAHRPLWEREMTRTLRRLRRWIEK